MKALTIIHPLYGASEVPYSESTVTFWEHQNHINRKHRDAEKHIVTFFESDGSTLYPTPPPTTKPVTTIPAVPLAKSESELALIRRNQELEERLSRLEALAFPTVPVTEPEAPAKTKVSKAKLVDTPPPPAMEDEFDINI